MSATKANTLCKKERLCGKRMIAELFVSGKSFFHPPFRVIWMKTTGGDAPVRFAVSVPKRRFKRAVHRNLIKRRTREAFRLNKQLLHNFVEEGQQILLMLVYTSDEISLFNELNGSMKKILQHIASKHAASG
ncbi:MAG: ribonuclease P protein component [Bacteroidales bacterium]|jgi:ribonuclease P protein component|nr:ribonuclease P protein component [Bacteroidales bacterium]